MNKGLNVENIRLAISSVRSQRLRMWLTALIISFGIMALVGILSATDAIKQSLAGNFSMLGANTFTIKNSDAGFRFGRDGKKPKYWPKITFDQAMTFKDRFHFQQTQVSISYIISGIAEIKKDEKKTDPNVQVWAVDAEYFATAGYEMAEGRNFSGIDIAEGRPMAIIGQDIVSILFPSTNPLGQVITFRGKRLQIVGMLDEKGSSSIFSGDRAIFVPITFARKSLSTTNPGFALNVMAPNKDVLDACEYESIALMRAVRKQKPKEENSFAIQRSDSLANMLIDQMGLVATGAFVIGAIALFSAAIALMNIMLVSVSERTREIGTLKAIGAKRNSILIQFLIEAIVVCIMGGLIGAVLGIGIGNWVSALVGGTFFIPWVWIVTALIICIVVGIVAGLYPAMKAARQDPIEALRYE